METENILILLAEISVALAGFAGIVSALHRRSYGEWSPEHRFGVVVLLAGSFSALFWAVFALILLNAGVARTWGLCSTLWALSTVLANLLFWRQLPKTIKGNPIAPIAHTGALAIVVSLQVYNVLALQQAWPFLVAVAFLLGSGSASFVQLVVTDPQPTPSSAPAAQQGVEPDVE